jgi:hypothetical protein
MEPRSSSRGFSIRDHCRRRDRVWLPDEEPQDRDDELELADALE